MSDEQRVPSGGRSLPGGTSRFAPGSDSDQMARFGENGHLRDGNGSGEGPRDRSMGQSSGEATGRDRGLDGGVGRDGEDRADRSGSRDNVDPGERRGREDVNNSRSSGGDSSERRDIRSDSSGRGDSRGSRSGGNSSRGSNGNSGGSGSRNKKSAGSKLKGGLTSWMPWAFLVVLLGFSFSNSSSLPFVYDRNIEENMNLFVTEIENESVFPFGEVDREKTGIDRISPDMVYHMGIPRYYVFVYDETADPDRYEEFSKAVTEYQTLEDVPVFKLSALDADKFGYYEFSAGSPQVVELTRVADENEAVVTKNYYLVSDWKEDWLDYSGDRKWYDKLLGR